MKVSKPTYLFHGAGTYLERQKHQIKKRTYENEIHKFNKLERYQKYVSIYEIDKSWLEKYQKYLSQELNNKINTVHGDFRTIRKYIKIGMDEGLITKISLYTL